MLRDQVPEDPEVHGLLALMLHCEARRPARRSVDGKFVPLSEQDPRSWVAPLIDEAERELMAAARNARLGRFQLEAAIQSVHAERAHSGRTDWKAIARFYDQLVQVAPSLGAAVGRAAAHAGSQAQAGLLDSIDSNAVTSHQPYWAVRAHLLRELGKRREAADAFDRAIGLSEDDAVRTFLLERRP